MTDMDNTVAGAALEQSSKLIQGAQRLHGDRSPDWHEGADFAQKLVAKQAELHFRAANPLKRNIRREQFPVGARVFAVNPDSYLRERFGVIAWATIGRVTGHSAIAPDDTGVLVDWSGGGSGRDVRCELHELEAYDREQSEFGEAMTTMVEKALAVPAPPAAVAADLVAQLTAGSADQTLWTVAAVRMMFTAAITQLLETTGQTAGGSSVTENPEHSA